MTTYLIIFACVLASFLISAGIGIYIETHSWNKGYCRKCGGKFKLFDYDSTGARGYECEDCYYKIWISYYCVDKERKK